MEDTTTGKQDQASFGVDFIAKPLEQIWSDGATVLVYPDGTVVNRLTGRLIKAGVKAHLIINTLLFQLMVRNSAPASFITSGAITLTNASQLYQLTNENFVCNTIRLLAPAGNAGTVISEAIQTFQQLLVQSNSELASQSTWLLAIQKRLN